jgi:hypothetical protein
MRRPRKAGLVVLLLLGLSGCASVPQRPIWSSPSTIEPGRTEPPATSRFSWWRRPGGESSHAKGSVSGLTQTTKAGPRAGDPTLPLNAWPDPPAQGFSRYFPMLSGRWNGSKTEQPDATPAGRSNVSQVSTRSGATAKPAVVLDDRAVRAVGASDAADLDSSGGKPLLEQRSSSMPPPTPAPLTARARPYALPAAISELEFDISSRAIRPDNPPALAEPKPPAVASLETAEVISASSPGNATVEPDSVPEQPEREPGSEPVEITTTDPDTDLEAATESNRQTADDDQPDQEQAPPAITRSVPVARSATQTLPQPPPAAAQPTPAQPIYASPPPVAPPRVRDSLFGWAGFRLPAEPLPSSQLPAATFPPSYDQPAPAAHVHSVSPTPQANTAASQQAPMFGGWKPVLIPALIEKLKNWSHGCDCHGCHQGSASSCCQSCTCCGLKTPKVSTTPQAHAEATWQLP